MKTRTELETMAQSIRRGGSFHNFSPADVLALQEFAMDIKDVRLYDVLESYWQGQKHHQHSYALVDCARPMVCACGEIQP